MLDSEQFSLRSAKSDRLLGQTLPARSPRVRPSRHHTPTLAWLLLCGLPLLELATAASARADRLRLELDRLQHGSLELHGLRLQVGGHAVPRLQLQLDQLRHGDQLAWSNLSVDCELRQVSEDAQVERCEGRLYGLGEPLAFDLQHRGSVWVVGLESAQGGSLQLEWDGGLGFSVRLDGSTMQGLIALLPVGLRPEGAPDARLSGRLRVDFAQDGAWRVEGPLSIEALAFELADAGVIADALQLDARIALTPHAQGWQLFWRSRVLAGELLAGPVFVDFADAAVDLDFQLRPGAMGELQLRELLLHDPDRLSVQAQADLLDGDLLDWALNRVDLRLPGAVDRYAGDLLAGIGFRGLESSGRVRAVLAGNGARILQLAADFDDVWMDDPGQRIGIAGLHGRLAPGDPLPQRLGWQGVSVYGLPLGAAELELIGQRGGLVLSRPARIPALGGALGIDALFWHPERADDGQNFGLALSAQRLSMVELSQRLGWPQMGGTLSGTLPGLRVQDGVIEVDGGLEVELFDGRVRIDNLALERPFGVLPTLSADLIARGLDLKLVTGTFAFGAIEGRLDADVSGLRLLDWRPVAFDAFLRTSTTAAGPRRLSQRAVDSLSALGGAGGMAALQQTALRFFESFRYEQIGLRCVLRDHVCEMSGIGPADTGYYIVRGSGLPRLNVIGFQRQVDWPVLLARLRQATEGGVRVGGG